MSNFSEEKNVLMMMSLMKAHNIKKVIVSPGTTNVSLVVSMQQDDYFELYSDYDERSAAYMACGMAAECGEPVALSCTQATASRNYFSGLTEAYYRKLPVVAITSTQHPGRIGQGFQQAIDRSVQPVDTVKLRVQVPIIHTAQDEWHCNVLINRALTELRRNGGRPVHINLFTTYSRVFNQNSLPQERVIQRVTYFDAYKNRLPEIPDGVNIAIFVGAHRKWTVEQLDVVNAFCDKYNAVVCCDQVSNYHGNYRVNVVLASYQWEYNTPAMGADIVIHIGEITGMPLRIHAKEVWRVDPNGEIMDTFQTQRYIFAMEEEYFFSVYADRATGASDHTYLKLWQSEAKKISEALPELPFSNAWLAKNTLPKLPEDCILHMGIYNSYRMWSMFEAPGSVVGYANTGGYGIDGGLSSLLGNSLVTDKLVFGVFGDLAFFYDMNSLGNRHYGKNVRIILVNNGLGTEFKNPDNRAYQFGDDANPYIAAEGHNGAKSKKLVKHYAEDLGFKYLSAENKEEYMENLPTFLSPEMDSSIIFEVFVDTKEDTEAYSVLSHSHTTVKGKVKTEVKKVLGGEGIKTVKKLLGRNRDF